jgi:predicted RNase H-like HicB family nuclease
MRKAIVYQDEDGVWVAEIPSLPGCHSDGSTLEEAVENVREAMKVWIETQQACGQPVPPEDRDVRVVLLPAA